MKRLFERPYDKSDPNWPIKGYLDTVYDDGDFLKVVEYVLMKAGYTIDGGYCCFPDMNSPFEEEHFDGVEFAYGYSVEDQDRVIVSEETCLRYIKLACNKYIERHPEDRQKITDLLNKSAL